MPLTTVTVSIAALQVVGSALPYGRVRFELTAADVDGGIVVPMAASVTLGADGTGTIELWPNSRGTQGTQYRVMVYSRKGVLQDSALATVPTSDCNLHDILSLDAPAVVSNALVSLADATDSAKGSALVGSYDPVAPAYLKTVSDITSGIPVSLLRFIDPSEYDSIFLRTATKDYGPQIQEAEDELYSGTKHLGGTLKWPHGRLRTGQTIQKKPRVHWEGENGAFDSSQSTLAPVNNQMITLVTNDRTVGTAVATGEDGLSQRLYDFRIANLNLQGTTGGTFTRSARALRLVGTWCAQLEGVRFGGFGIAVELIDCNVITMLRNFVSGGLLLESVADSIFVANQIGPNDYPSMDNDRHNVIMWLSGAGAWKNTIQSNIIYNCPNGVAQTIAVTAGVQNIVCTGHDFIDETPVTIETTGTVPTGLSAAETATMWVKVVDANTIKLSSSRANYHAGTYLTPSTVGSGIHSLRVGGKATLFLNNGAKKNTISGNRFDQSYHSNVVLAGAHLNVLSANAIHEAGRANLTGQTAVRLVAANQNSLTGNVIDGTVTAAAAGTSNQTKGLAIDASSSDNRLAGNVIVNHSVSNIEDSGTRTLMAERRTIDLPAMLWEVSSGTPALTNLTGTRRKAFAFDAATDELIQYWWSPPPGYTKWTATFRWCNLGAGSGNVDWFLQYEEDASGSDVSDNEDNGVTINQAAGLQDILVQGVATSVITLTGDGRQVSLRMKRTGTAGSDTLANDAGFISVQLTAYE